MTNGHKLNMRKEAKKDMMVKFGKKIVKFRVPILILSILLLIPSALGYLHTRINYDVLTYLPDNIETMKGQDILVELGFKPLANPLMRNTVGRKVSLKQGSKLEGTPMDKIVRTLEANGYEVIGLD